MNIPIHCVCVRIACELIQAVYKTKLKQANQSMHVYANPEPFVITYKIFCTKYSSRLTKVYNIVSKQSCRNKMHLEMVIEQTTYNFDEPDHCTHDVQCTPYTRIVLVCSHTCSSDHYMSIAASGYGWLICDPDL